MATMATMDTNARQFSGIWRYSSAVHGYPRKVTERTLLDLIWTSPRASSRGPDTGPASKFLKYCVMFWWTW